MGSDMNVHEGHRQRVKRRILNNESVEPHVLLEALLYYAIPRRDTNLLAHTLINKFGSFAGVLEASYEELLETEGVGEHCAAMIKLLMPTIDMYIKQKENPKREQITPTNINRVVRNLFMSYSNEVLFAVMLDSSFKVISCEKISEGTVDRAPVYSREIIKRTLASGATNVILAHNHPNDVAVFSKADIEVTKLVDNALAFINVRLVDHIVVTQEKCISILREIRGMDL